MANAARFIGADRLQTRWDLIDLEGFLPSDHRAQIVVSFVESLDLGELCAAIELREGAQGLQQQAQGQGNGQGGRGYKAVGRRPGGGSTARRPPCKDEDPARAGTSPGTSCPRRPPRRTAPGLRSLAWPRIVSA